MSECWLNNRFEHIPDDHLTDIYCTWLREPMSPPWSMVKTWFAHILGIMPRPVWTKLGENIDMFRDYLCMDCAIYPPGLISFNLHTQKFTRPLPKVSKSSVNVAFFASSLLCTRPSKWPRLFPCLNLICTERAANTPSHSPHAFTMFRFVLRSSWTLNLPLKCSNLLSMRCTGEGAFAFALEASIFDVRTRGQKGEDNKI